MNPRVSIGIPSYNHEKYISETIDSILNQTFQDFEIVITDDGSSDDTIKVIKNFSDPRIKLFVFEENQGACKALNNCIINSKGEYFTYISSDDVWEHDKLQKQVEFLDENPQVPAVFTKVKIIDEYGNEFKDENHFYFSVFDVDNRSRSRWLNHFFYKGNCICHPSIMIKKSVYDEIGFYNELMANVPDFDMWVRLCLEYDIHILDEKLTKFRIRNNEENISGNKIKTHLRVRFEKLHILDNYLKIEDIEFFSKVFPKANKFGILKAHMIPYFLARLAYETNLDYMQLWALNTLFNFMHSNEILDELEKDYDFSYPDFLEMSTNGDLFNIQLIHNREVEIQKRNHMLNEKDLKLKNEQAKRVNLERKIRTLSKSRKNEIYKNFQILFSGYLSKKPIPKRGKLAQLSNIPYLFILLHSKGNLKKAWTNIKEYQAIKNLKLFDEKYYLNKYNNVLISGMNPLIHYMYYGYKENKFPNETFQGGYYLNKYKNVKASGMNPFVHYCLYGINENKKINKDFVSVVVTTYNHEKYIKECIDSVLMQKSVQIELIIGDDCSTDNTRKILEEYQKQYQSIIKLLPLTKNMGVTKNIKRCMEAVTGNYVAICEGDDYWTDSYKLKKQVNFLKKRQDCAMCFNSILILHEDKQKKNYIQPKITKKTLTTRDLVSDNFIGNFSSCMYRTNVIKKLSDQLYDLFTVDWMFNIACSEYGKIGFLNENMNVYRIHDTGLWSGKDSEEKISDLVELIELYNEFFSFKYDSEFKKFKEKFL